MKPLSKKFSAFLQSYYKGPDHPMKGRLWRWFRRLSGHSRMTIPYGAGGWISKAASRAMDPNLKLAGMGDYYIFRYNIYMPIKFLAACLLLLSAGPLRADEVLLRISVESLKNIQVQVPPAKPQLLKAMKGHILAEGELVGLYQR